MPPARHLRQGREDARVIPGTLFGPDIALIIVLIGVAALVAHVLRLAPPLVFLAVGLLAGPLLGVVAGGHAAEVLVDLGLVFLLFLIGLDLKAERVRPTLSTTLRVSPVQMLVTFLVFFGLTSLFFDTTTALVVGIASTYSSTAVVLQMLAERNEVDTTAGRLDTGLLLFEDMTVIVVIAAITAGGAAAGIAGALARTLLALTVVGGAAYLAARSVLPRLLPRSYDRPHVYFMQAVGVLFLFLGLSELVGVSHEIGAFFAGIALAQLPGNDELHERVRPLTAFTMALFFVSLSVGLTASDLLVHWQLAVLFSLVVLVDKFVVHLGLFRLAGQDRETSVRAALNMMQTSEFSLVLGAAALSAGLIAPGVLGLLTLVALVTMMVSTVFIDRQDSIVGFLGEASHPPHRESGAVMVGFGESGPDVLAALAEHVDDIVVVTPSRAAARALAGTEHEHVFADIRHEEIKRRAGFHTARVVVGVDVPPEAGADMLAARDGVVMVTDDPDDAELFRDAGAAAVLDRTELGADRFRETVERLLGGGADG